MVKGGGLGRLPGTCESARGGDCGLRVNHEVSEEFFSTAFYRDFLIFLVPESSQLGSRAPPQSPIFDPTVGGRTVYSECVSVHARLSVECVHPQVLKGYCVLGRE